MALSRFCLDGLPHSEIPGSKPVCGSPGLIAAYHVLLRRPAPRHPPYALSSLTTTFTLLGTLCLCSLAMCRCPCFRDLRLSMNRGLCARLGSAEAPPVVHPGRRPRSTTADVCGACRLLFGAGGADRARTGDLRLARAALSRAELQPRGALGAGLVGLSGFEPLTSRLSGVRSNQLSYRPAQRTSSRFV